MINTTVLGAAGRMGRILAAQIVADPDLTQVGAVEFPGYPLLGRDVGTVAGLDACGVALTDDLAAAIAEADAVIDFSTPESTMAAAPLVIDKGAVLIIGTTGLTEANKSEIRALADRGGRIMLAPNMSIGVNLLFHLCAKVGSLLGPDYDIEVVEMHHNRKTDAPSGTAVRLGEILAEVSGLDYEHDARHGRVGNVGARTSKEIGMHALRGGDVVGDHTVIFATAGERVELAHKASSRETFAKGALRAIKFLMLAQPGLYDMQDVLGLK